MIKSNSQLSIEDLSEDKLRIYYDLINVIEGLSKEEAKYVLEKMEIYLNKSCKECPMCNCIFDEDA